MCLKRIATTTTRFSLPHVPEQRTLGDSIARGRADHRPRRTCYLWTGTPGSQPREQAEFCKEALSGILLSAISDHFPVFVGVGNSYQDISKESLIFKSRSFSDQAFANMERYLSQLDWTFLSNIELNDAYSKFLGEINNCIDHFAPEKTTVIPHHKIIRQPWITKGILKSSKRLTKLYRRKHELTIQYTTYRNLFNNIKKKAREQYYDSLLKEAKNDIKKTWKILRPLVGKQRQKEPILNDFLINNNTVTDSSAIANEFSKFFANVGKDLQNNISNAQKSCYIWCRYNFNTPIIKSDIDFVFAKLTVRSMF